MLLTITGGRTQDELGSDAVTGVVSVAAPEDGEEGVSIHFEARPSPTARHVCWFIVPPAMLRHPACQESGRKSGT